MAWVAARPDVTLLLAHHTGPACLDLPNNQPLLLDSLLQSPAGNAEERKGDRDECICVPTVTWTTQDEWNPHQLTWTGLKARVEDSR